MNGKLEIIAHAISDWHKLAGRNVPEDLELESRAKVFINQGLDSVSDLNQLKTALKSAYHSSTTVVPTFKDVIRELKANKPAKKEGKTEESHPYFGYDEWYKPGYTRHIFPDSDPRAHQNAHMHNEFGEIIDVGDLGLDWYRLRNKEASESAQFGFSS